MKPHTERELEKKSEAADVYEIIRPGQRLRFRMRDGRMLHVKGVPWWDDVIAMVLAIIFGGVVALTLSTILRWLT